MKETGFSEFCATNPPAGTVTVTAGAGTVIVIVADGFDPWTELDATMDSMTAEVGSGEATADVGAEVGCARTVTVTVGLTLSQNHGSRKGQGGGVSGVMAAT